jgi:hypothetical protein
LCNSNDINPNIATEVVNLTTSWEIACSGVAAALLPLQFINNTSTNHNLKIFILNDNVYLRQPVIVRRRGQFVSKFTEYAIDLLLNQ